MTTLLVPTDLSENATNALNYAAALANDRKAKIIILQILNLPQSASELSFILPDPDPAQLAACEATLKNIASQLKQTYTAIKEISTICQFDYQLTNLNDVVKAHKADLVVMGAPGHTEVADLISGTFTTNFIKSAVCPVLVVPRQATYKQLSKVVYASDFDSDETIFLKQLFQFTQPAAAQISILNVETDAEKLTDPNDPRIQSIVKHFPYNRFTIEQVKENSVIEGIKAYVTANQVEMLAVSIHAKSIFEDLFHTSLSKKLVYHTTVPILALPEKPYKIPHPTGTTDEIKKQLYNKKD